ncbi:MAG: glycosyltransferase family 1 protein [Magnetococcales bacterium]|nr:glycosyltransferase family 1 protein [Magnetococcales bacterium]
MSDPVETVVRLVNENNHDGLLDYVRTTPIDPNQLLTILYHLLALRHFAPALVLADHLQEGGFRHQILSLALAIGGVVLDRPEMETRGMADLSALADRLTPQQQASTYAQIVVPVMRHLAGAYLRANDTGRILKLLAILKADVPAMREILDAGEESDQLAGPGMSWAGELSDEGDFLHVFWYCAAVACGVPIVRDPAPGMAACHIRFTSRAGRDRVLTRGGFESMRQGALLVQEYAEEMHRHCTPGVHYLEFATLRELRAIARFLREHPEEAEAIRQRGQALARQRYDHEWLPGVVDGVAGSRWLVLCEVEEALAMLDEIRRSAPHIGLRILDLAAILADPGRVDGVCLTDRAEVRERLVRVGGLAPERVILLEALRNSPRVPV